MTQFTRPSKTNLAAVGLGLAVAFCAGAAAAQPAPARAPQLQAVIDCRALTDGAARLACYDKAAASLDQAEAKGEVVVVDREQVRAANRQAFGFNFRMPEIFTRSEEAPTLDRISAVATRAWQSGGKWMVELEDGAIWAQIDSERVNRDPKKGSKVEIRKASMGSFFMNLDGQRAVRAKRAD